MMYYYNDYYPTHMFGFGYVFMFLFWGLIIYGLFMLIRRGEETHHKNNAIEILKERYAKGEITKEQFENMKKDLQ